MDRQACLRIYYNTEPTTQGYIVATVHSEQVIQFVSELIGRIHQCTEANTN